MNRFATAARRVRPAISLLLVAALATAPTAAAGQGGSDRPFRGTLGGEVNFHYDWSDPVCPVTTATDATGTVSHLGAVTTHWTHCPPVVLPGYTDGHALFVAANGDRLYGAYEDADGDSPFTIEIVGGTGRFDGAQGTFTLWFEAAGAWGEDDLPVNPWTWTAELEGVISY